MQKVVLSVLFIVSSLLMFSCSNQDEVVPFSSGTSTNNTATIEKAANQATVTVKAGSNVNSINVKPGIKVSGSVILSSATPETFSIEIEGSAELKFEIFNSFSDLRNGKGKEVTESEIAQYFGQRKFLKVTASLIGEKASKKADVGAQVTLRVGGSESTAILNGPGYETFTGISLSLATPENFSIETEGSPKLKFEIVNSISDVFEGKGMEITKDKISQYFGQDKLLIATISL